MFSLPHTGDHYIQRSMIKTPVTLRWTRAKKILATNNLVAGEGEVLVPSSTNGNYKVHVHFDAQGYLNGAQCTCKDFYGNAAILKDAGAVEARDINVPAWAQRRAREKYNVVTAVQNGEEHGIPLHYSGGHVTLVCKHILAAATVVTAKNMGWTVADLLALGN